MCWTDPPFLARQLYSFRNWHFEPRSCKECTQEEIISQLGTNACHQMKCSCLGEWGSGVFFQYYNVCYCTEKFDGETSLRNFQTELYSKLPKHLCSNRGTKMNAKCFHATIFCLLIIFGHKNNSKAIKDQLKPTFKMPRRHLSVSDLNLTHGCLMKANIQTLQCSTETLLISDVMK